MFIFKAAILKLDSNQMFGGFITAVNDGDLSFSFDITFSLGYDYNSKLYDHKSIIWRIGSKFLGLNGKLSYVFKTLSDISSEEVPHLQVSQVVRLNFPFLYSLYPQVPPISF